MSDKPVPTKFALLDDATPPEDQYLIPQWVGDAFCGSESLSHDAMTCPTCILELHRVTSGRRVRFSRPTKLQSPLVVESTVDGLVISRPSGATKPGSPDLTAHRPATRPTRSRKGRSSYLVDAVGWGIVQGPDPVRSIDAAPGERVPIVAMTQRALVDLADALYREHGLPELIGSVDGRRNSWQYETEPLLRTRTPSARQAARDLYEPRDVDNPSIARWSGNMLAYFPEVRDRGIVEGDESTWGDAVDGDSRTYERPAEQYRGRLGLGPIHVRRDAGETDVITDGATVHLIAPDVERWDDETRSYVESAWIGHKRYDRPATRETERTRHRATVSANRVAESPEVIALADEIAPHLATARERSEPATWEHNGYNVTARWSETKSRYRVTVYRNLAELPRPSRVASFDSRSAKSTALRLSSL